MNGRLNCRPFLYENGHRIENAEQKSKFAAITTKTRCSATGFRVNCLFPLANHFCLWCLQVRIWVIFYGISGQNCTFFSPVSEVYGHLTSF